MNNRITTTILALALSASLVYSQENAPVNGAEQQAKQTLLDRTLHQDPKIVTGKLQNGMSYIIRPTKEPVGRGSVRLFVGTGSMDESPETSGISHFLEHMVFNGSRTFKRGELIPAMQKLGLGFGGDANAYTSLLQTVYMLDLPNLKDETVNFALTIMRDFADGATLEDDAIDHERGIVISELKARDSESYRSAIAALGQLTEGTRVSTYMPIGKEEVIRNASYETVRDYYHRHYVPDRMTLILTGDFTPETAEDWIHRHFDSMEKRPNPERPWINDRPTTGPTDVILPNKEQASTSISVSIISPFKLKEDTFEQRLEDLPLEIASALVNLRLSRIAQQPDSPFIKAQVGTESIFDTADVFSLNIISQPDKWQAGLSRAEQELRRAIQYGFSPQEFQQVIAAMQARLSHAIESWDTVSADTMASSIVDSLASHKTNTTPQETQRVLTIGLQEILADPSVCQAALAKAYEASKAKLTLSGTVPEGVTGETLRQTFKTSSNIQVEKPVIQETKPFAYDHIGDPGTITQQSTISDIGVTTLTLSNGIKVNLKPVDFKKGSITVIASVDGGALKLPHKPGLATSANNVLTLGGLEAHDIDELQRIMIGHNVDLNIGIGDKRINFSGGTTQEDLELQCKLLAAGILHPGFKQEAIELMKRNLPNFYRRLDTTPQGAYSRQAPRVLYGDDTRFNVPSQAEVEAITLDDIKSALLPHLKDGAIEVTIVGDFDIEKTLPIIERTFGAMPQRKTEFEPLTEEQSTVTFQPWGQRCFFRYPTDLDKTLVSHVRPAGNGMDQHRNRRLRLLTSIVREKLFDGIRATMGETYSPIVSLELNPAHPDAAVITTVSAGVMGNREKVSSAMDSILAGIGKGDITQEDFDCAIRPMIAQAEKSLRTNAFWCSSLQELQSNPEALPLIQDLIDDLKSITFHEIQDLGKEIFGKQNTNYFFTVPASYQVDGSEEKETDKTEEAVPVANQKDPLPPAVSTNKTQDIGQATDTTRSTLKNALDDLGMCYTVITTEATAALPEWKQVAEALVKKYKGAKLIVLPVIDEENCTRALRSTSARYAAYVLRPEEIGRETVNDLHRAARQVDDDPWGDCIWGIVTGFSAADAMRIAQDDKPLVIKRVLGTTNVDSTPFEYSYCITDWSGSPVLEQSGYQKPTTTTYTSATPEGKAIQENGIQGKFAEKLSKAHPEMLITSSHASQFNLEMPFSKGLVFSANNRLRQLPLPQLGMFGAAQITALVDKDQVPSNITPLETKEVEPDGTTRVWIAAGNCLFGDAAHTKQSMCVTALSAYTCNQVVGYTVPSWYGAGGWGTLSTFLANSDGTSLAEAWFLNNQFILNSTMQIDPKLLDVRFDEPQVGPGLQAAIINKNPKVTIETAKDAIGLVHDRDVVAFYGDPAWRASVDTSHTACPFSVEWNGSKEFVIRANKSTKGRLAVWFPTAATGAGATGCSAKEAIFTNDFILFPELEMKEGDTKVVTIE